MKAKYFLMVGMALMAFSLTARAELYTAYLSSAQEVPTNASTATGYARLNLNRNTGAFTLSLTFTGLGSNQTASHIHGNAAIGANSAVLFNIGSTGATSGTLNSTGTMTAAQMTALRNHLFYVNVHSTNLPGGEIRGQLGVARPVDQDGDGRTDPQVLRFPSTTPPATAPIDWYALRSTGGFQAVGPFGNANTDFPTPGDFDGDFIGDIAVYRAGATAGAQSFFYILQSSNNVVNFIDWGINGDAAVARDYDGDGKTDPAVFRDGPNAGSPGVWWIIYSTTQVRGAITWGTSGATTSSFDSPVPADYDGDGKVDVAVYRFGISPTNTYIILRSSDNGVRYATFGNFNTDYILPGDYDGDGLADLAVGRTGATGTSPMTWIVQRSSDSAVTYLNFGISSDLPTQGDWDGDGRTDPSVFRRGAVNGAQSTFFSFNSLTQSVSYLPWGIQPDFPVNNFDAR